MIRCYYSQKTIYFAAMARRHRVIGCCAFLLGILVLLGRGPGFLFDTPQALFGSFLLLGMLFFSYRWLLNIEKITPRHAGDVITLDDDEIRLATAGGTQITFPREGLNVEKTCSTIGYAIYIIRHSQFTAEPKIVLTADMENAKELVETIRPGAWDTGSE